MLRAIGDEKTQIKSYQADKSTSVQIIVGQQVFDFISNENFITGWDKLYENCRWATVFQSRKFVTTWYETYQKAWNPIIVIGTNNGKLTGLLHLAQNETGLITGAGEELAEYHVWLTNDDTNDFIEKAIKKVFTAFKGCKIQLKYLPPDTPINWINEASFIRRHCFINPFKHPLLQLNPVYLEKELRKKNRKEKINRLKRLGLLQFKHITDYDKFNSILDELIYQFDFRKGAMYNAFFFLTDANRKKFLVALFKNELLHVSVLQLNEKIIASNVSIYGKSWVHLQGMNTHDPSYARYSPGILHFLMLGQVLEKDGFSIFDLTPGDAPYKDILANDYTTSYKLIIDKKSNILAYSLKSKTANYLKKGLSRMRISPVDLKRKIQFYQDKIKHLTNQNSLIPNYIKSTINYTGSKNNLYVLQKESIKPFPDFYVPKKNDLQDLLQFDTTGTWMTRWEFLDDAMRRFELGQSCFTYCENEQLLFCVWICNDLTKEDCKLLKFYQNIQTSVFLDGIYYHPQFDALLKSCLIAVTTLAVESNNDNNIYAIAKRNNKHLNQVLQSIGFNPMI